MIIDIFNHLPEPEHVTFELLVLSRSPGYLQLLGPSIGRGIGMSDEEVKGLVQAGGEEEVLKILLSYLEGRTLASEVLVAQMDRAGIDWTILHAEDNGPRFGVDPLPEEFWVGHCCIGCRGTHQGDSRHETPP